jgi:exopolysaccharide biosynthesis polyprenyl glycosylphosphotransferase
MQGLNVLLDALTICLAFGIALALRFFHESIPLLGQIPSRAWLDEGAVRSEYAVLFLVNLCVWIVYLRKSGLYVSGVNYSWDRILKIHGKALLLSILVTGGVVFILKILLSRLLFGYFFVTVFGLLLAKQALVYSAVRQFWSSEAHKRHALVIGAARPAERFARIISDAQDSGYKLVGILATDDSEPIVINEGKTAGSIADLEGVLVQSPVEEVFIVGGAKEIAELAPIAQSLLEKGRVVSLVSTLSSGQGGLRGRVTDFSGVPMISFGPMPKDEVHGVMKRIIDVTLSVAALLALSPLLLGIALLIKTNDPGPVIFRQRRVGLGGEEFWMYKFRTMRVDAENVLRANPVLYRQYLDNDCKLPEAQDPRTTRLGRFLRKSSLDELPQIWNILRGDMTIVGPRPILPEQIGAYDPYLDLYLSIRPGLTGRWQTTGRSSVSYPERAYMDFDYIGQHSLSADLSIIAKTIPAVLKKKGAH